MFDSARQARMRAIFEKVGREGYANGSASPELRKFEERLSRLKTKMKAHLERHAPVWIARENKKLIDLHKGRLKPALTPKWIVQTEASPAALARLAVRNIEQRNASRMAQLESIAKNNRVNIENSTQKKASVLTKKFNMSL